MSTACLEHTPDACTETYEDVRNMIYKIAHRYSTCNQLPFEEVLSAANYVFMRAYTYKYKPKGKPATFSTRLYNSLNWELKDFLKKEIKHTGHLEVNEEIVGSTNVDANYRIQLDTEILSEDARSIVRLILDTPQDIAPLLRWEKVRSSRSYLAVLREHLHDMGWGTKRIQESFSELRHLFSS